MVITHVFVTSFYFSEHQKKKKAKPWVSKQYLIPTLMSPGHNYGLSKYFYIALDFSHLLATNC